MISYGWIPASQGLRARARRGDRAPGRRGSISAALCKNRARERDRPEPPAAPEPGAPRGGAGDAARALLRPRVRAGPHPVHGADGRRADLDRGRQGDADPRGPLVGLGRLRLAHERRRARGDARAVHDLRRDGGDARRRPEHPAGVRGLGPPLRRRLRDRAPGPDRPLRPGQPRGPPAAPLADHRPRRGARSIGSGLLVAAAFADGALQGALWTLAPCHRPRRPAAVRRRGLAAGARATSPSATASSSSSRWASRSWPSASAPSSASTPGS